MKKLLLLSFLSITIQTKAQNVGIGNSTPTEKLDVTGNINVTGEIKPTGITGLNGQVLTSNGDATMRWGFPSDGKEVGFGPWGETARYIEAYQPFGTTDGMPNDYFGNRVAMSGNYAIANDNNQTIIFKKNESTFLWEPTQTINISGNIAISGDHIIIGNPGELNGTGSVNFYKRNEVTNIWEPNGTFYGLPDNTSPQEEEAEFFGISVAISGEKAIVGASYDGVSGNETREFGSATFFERNTTTNIWSRGGKIRNQNPSIVDQFGSSVAISENFAIVGCQNDDPDSGPDALNNFNWGSISIYKKNLTTGNFNFHSKIFEPINPLVSNRFGRSISTDGNYFIVSTINSVYFLKYNSTTDAFDVQVKILSNGVVNNNFGNSVCLSGDLAVVGADNDNQGLGPVRTGAATIYRRIGTVWQEIQKFNPPHGNIENDRFGTSVAIEAQNKSFVVGAPSIQSYTGLVFFGEVK